MYSPFAHTACKILELSINWNVLKYCLIVTTVVLVFASFPNSAVVYNDKTEYWYYTDCFYKENSTKWMIHFPGKEKIMWPLIQTLRTLFKRSKVHDHTSSVHISSAVAVFRWFWETELRMVPSKCALWVVYKLRRHTSTLSKTRT